MLVKGPYYYKFYEIFEHFNLYFFPRLHNLVTSRQQDKQNISSLERKLNDEKKLRSGIESQLNSERKAKKAEEAAAARAVALATASSAQR